MKNWNGLFSLTVVFLIMTNGYSQTEADTKAVTYSPHGDKLSCHMNMGPTGASAWMRGYHFQVMRIDHGSPAHGVLELGDMVIGVDASFFGEGRDSRILLGNAIENAEASGQPLSLTVIRDHVQQVVSLALPKRGGFQPGWPFGDTKSRNILLQACQTLLDTQLPDGHVPTDGSMGTFLTGLLLLAAGEPALLDGARRAVYAVDAIDYLKQDYNNWPMGYGGLLLAEYFLATGDDSVLEKLAWIADELARGQMNCGSWGHKSPGEGYGALNQPGIIDAMTLVLAQACGVDVDEAAMNKALDFFGRYAGVGSIPYGDHMPGALLDDNGKNASAAVLMHLAGREAEASVFSRSVATSYWMREDGHTGAYFSLLWGPLAASLAGREAFDAFMDYQVWFYNLARTWKGALVHLPYQEALTRFDDSGYIYFGGDFTTGGLALAFALPGKRLRILGASRSVFSPATELSSSALRAARRHYRKRDWKALDHLLGEIDATQLDTLADKRGFEQLIGARSLLKASTERVLIEIESNIVNGAAYLASAQFNALKRRLGEQGDERFAALEQRFADGGVAWGVREGKRYKDAWKAMKGIAVMSWTAQGWQARRLLEGLPTLRPPIWEPLSPTAESGDVTWKTRLIADGATLEEGWQQAGFDDRDWLSGNGVMIADKHMDTVGMVAARRVFVVKDVTGDTLRIRLRTVRPANTRVFLNGALVAEAVRGQRGGYAAIELDDSAFSILKEGENVLAVISTAVAAGNNHLDVGLEICRQLPERRHLPVDRLDTPISVDYPGLDDTLRVRETRQRMERELQESYAEKTRDDLLQDLRDPVPYFRRLAVNALVDQGADAIEHALTLIDHPDWRVRSSVCDVIGKALAVSRDHEDMAMLQSLLVQQVPALITCLNDPHFWVRIRAASAIDGFGENAETALPTLSAMMQDPDEWVRTAAIRAISRLNPSPETAVKSAVAGLQNANSAYSVPRVAVSLLTAHAGVNDDQRLEGLLALLRQPPEGGGGRLLNDVMDQAMALDPEGEKLIPVLIDTALDKTHISRQRGNPWGKAVELLGRYGGSANAAVPALASILSDDHFKRIHDVATVALDAIQAESHKTQGEPPIEGQTVN